MSLKGFKVEDRILRIPVPSSRAYITERGILVMSATSYFQPGPEIKPRLILLSHKGDVISEPVEFSSGKNLLLHVSSGSTFVGLDNKLLRSRDLRKWRTVLTANTGNCLCQMAEGVEDTLFVQEYGFSGSPAIYRSTDAGETWDHLVDCHKLDKRALHFHCIAYDEFRRLLIATLGDRNTVKVALSEDYGDKWKTLYKGPYQCVPIEILKDRVVFGMDSRISCGFLVWYPSESRWETIHLKYVMKPKPSDLLQTADLKVLTNGLWTMSTTGGSLLCSTNLKEWRLLHFGVGKQFAFPHLLSNVRNGVVAAAMGNFVMIITSKDITISSVDVVQHAAFYSRLKDLANNAKRTIMSRARMKNG